MNNLVPDRNGRRFGTFLSWDPTRLFDHLMTWQPSGGEVVWSAYQSPIHLANTDDGATIAVDMPGVDPQDLELTFENGTLAIAGKRGEQIYRYNVTLGDTIDPDAIQAQLDKGVLTVRAYKRPEAKPRKIAVSAPTKTLDTGDSE
jgi:HSP20 family protein